MYINKYLQYQINIIYIYICQYTIIVDSLYQHPPSRSSSPPVAGAPQRALQRPAADPMGPMAAWRGAPLVTLCQWEFQDPKMEVLYLVDHPT